MVDTLTYVGRRFVNLLVVLWIAGTLNFAIPRLMPGDPIEQAFLALEVRGGPSQDVAALKASYEAKLGLDQPVLVQYANYWIGVATLDLGVSVVKYPAKVTSVIGPSIPWTLGLLGMSTIIAFVIGTLLGRSSPGRDPPGSCTFSPRCSWCSRRCPTTSLRSY